MANTNAGCTCRTTSIIHSSNGGATWTSQTTGLSAGDALLAVRFADDLHGWAVGFKNNNINDALIVTTANGGATWTAQAFPGSEFLVRVSAPDSNHAWAVGAGTVPATSNGGATWTSQPTGVPGAWSGVSFPDATHGWVVGFVNHNPNPPTPAIISTTNGGATWTSQTPPSGSDAFLNSVAFPDDSNGWVSPGTSGTALATTDGGAIWSNQGTITPGPQQLSFPDRSHGWGVIGDQVLVLLGGGSPSNCVSGSQPGNVTLSSSSSCANGASIAGNVTANGTQVVITNSAVSGNLTVSGGSLRLCGSTISGNVTVSGATGPVLIGDPTDDACAPNAISGFVSLTNDTGGLELRQDQISGSVSLSGDHGGGPLAEDTHPEVEANNISGNLSCTGDTPAAVDDGHANTVSGTRSGECGAPGF